MFNTSRLPVMLAFSLLLLVVGISIPASAEPTFAGVLGERNRITLGYQVNADAVQGFLPAPWRLNALASGPLRGSNFLVVLIDSVRDDDPQGKPRYGGNNPFVVFVAPGKNPENGQTAAVVLGGFASNPAYLPGYYQVYRPATINVRHLIESHTVDTEEVTDVWQVRDTTGAGGVELKLHSLRDLKTRARAKGEVQVISAKEPSLWRSYQYETATDVLKSVPENIDRVRAYTLRVTVPDYSKLFDGSEQLVGISAAPWYVRQIFAHQGRTENEQSSSRR